ncbi:hypothetical protein RQP46_007686 [Phenoliferia psychrophenolica]
MLERPHDLELGLGRRARGRTNETFNSTQKEAGRGDVTELLELEEQVTTVDKSSKSSRAASPFRPTTPQHPSPSHEVTSFERRTMARLAARWSAFLSKHPLLARAVSYSAGPSPPVVETQLRTFKFLRGTEAFFARRLHPLHLARHIVVPIFLIAWLVGFIFLVRESYFDSKTSAGAPQWISAADSFWSRDDECGLNGTYCTPFSGVSLLFRCPAQVLDVQLLNVRAVGPLEVIYQPLVVGGFDDLSTYRADAWICPAAVQQGLFGNRDGGCGQLERVGEFANYVGGTKNGVTSVGFPGTFPSSYRFKTGISQANCKDLRDDILGFNVAMTTVFSFLIRPAASVFYWVLFLMGYWHVVLVSDPTANPPDIATGFEYFLPSLFVAYAFWLHSWRWVVPAFDGAIIERTAWYLGGFWVGLLINVSLSWIPIDRLTAHDIKQQPGGLVAVICLVIFLALVITNQLRVIRRTGWVFFYLKWYAVGGVVIGILCAMPGLSFRLHHYFAAIILMPGCAFVTRPSALFQGFLLGMFLDGAGRWGLASILQTPASLVGDGSTGSPLPIFLTSATNFTIDQALIFWDAIPASVASNYDGFSLIVDDVLAWTGTATNYSIAALDRTLPHYFSLPDSEHLVNGRCEAIIALGPTIAQFVHFRANLDREYSKKLSEAASKARLQAIKEAEERVTSSKQTNTLEAGFMKFLEAADLDAREHLALADSLSHKVADALTTGAAKFEGVRKKHHSFAKALLAERDRTYSEREKAKQKYFDACDALEQARQKKSQAKDERSIEKASRAYDTAYDDMLVDKATFLLETDVANVAKARLYDSDLPSVHDFYQVLEGSTVSYLVHVLHAFTGIQSASLAKRADNNAMAEAAISSISVEQDQRQFVEAHSNKLASWELPRDLEFEECPAWHDSAEMPTTPSTVVYLQNVKIKATSKLGEISPVIESKRREISGLRNLREAYEKDRTLGDAASVLENLFDSLKDTTFLELQQTAQKAQVELINATLGDDGGPALRLHDFKSSSFVTPATCIVCEGSVWGKGLSCKVCGIAAHAKCELKVPAGCGTAGAAGVGRRRSKLGGGGLARSSSNATSSPLATKPSASSPVMPPPMRAPPAAATLETATMLYDYAATTAFELSVTAQALYDYEPQTEEELELVQDEFVSVTGSSAGDGWTEVSKDGRVGLVPTSYIQVV